MGTRGADIKSFHCTRFDLKLWLTIFCSLVDLVSANLNCQIDLLYKMKWSLNSPVGGAYAPPSVFFGRCICTAQTNFKKTLILFFKIEILELKFCKNTVFFVKKKYKFWLSYFFSKIKLKKRFFVIL